MTFMTNKGIDIKYPKERGEWAELRFMARAAEHGLRVAKPWGESAHYDFAVEFVARFLRIQVKSTMSIKKNTYNCSLRPNNKVYSVRDFDFLAVYIIPLDLWYIIPAEQAITGGQKLYLSPHCKSSRYETYKEAWHLLQEEKPRSASVPALVMSEASACEQDCDPPTDRGIDEGEDDAPQEEPEAAATSESTTSQSPAPRRTAIEVRLSGHHSYIQRELERISRRLKDQFS
jgi:hypothetical protein